MKLLLRFMCLLLPFSTIVQAATVDLSLTPQTSNVSVGDSFDVDVMGTLSGATSSGFDGGHFDLGFDPAILDATLITLHSPWAPISTAPTIDNSSGLIHSSDIGSLLGISDGTYNIATITFLAQNSGTSSLTFSGLLFTYDYASQIADVNKTDGSVNVSAVPIPAAGILLLSGIGFFTLISRRRASTA